MNGMRTPSALWCWNVVEWSDPEIEQWSKVLRDQVSADILDDTLCSIVQLLHWNPIHTSVAIHYGILGHRRKPE